MSTEIDVRTEAAAFQDAAYQNVDFGEPDLLARGLHREAVGGHWEELGRLQLDFLRRQGLRPEHRFLDVGCGSLRAGRLIAAHVDPGNYYGIDINRTLLEVGYDHELDEPGRSRLPRSNLRATDRFDADFGVPFDMAIAQSVFTHISLNWMRLCLYRVAKAMRPGGRFYVTFFEKPEGFPLDGVAWSGRLFTERNAYWYYQDDLRWVAARAPWTFRYIGDWAHPRGQRMVEYTRTDQKMEADGSEPGRR
ncbi:class I SAM-dependent methyltransferase [Micromonospora echinospora]|uniref:class I SAM-dependent methyltransferase n=1 Tax=Micromonospora echinospora TaxID=1877 RepID=UPI003CFB2B66